MFPDAEIPEGPHSSWGMSMTRSVDALNRTCISVDLGFKSCHEMCFGKPAPLPLLRFLTPGFCGERISKDPPKAGLCFDAVPTYSHSSGTARVLPKRPALLRSLAMLCDVTYQVTINPVEGGAYSTSSVPWVDKQDDDNFAIDDSDELESVQESSPDTNFERIKSVSSDTGDDTSIENFWRSHRDLADRFGRDAVCGESSTSFGNLGTR